ncbi:MAG: LysM peptidoglycan-binding domain-containing protein [Lentisphaeria bacterium]
MLRKLLNVGLLLLGVGGIAGSGCTAYDYGYGMTSSGASSGQATVASSSQNNQLEKKLARLQATVRQIAEAQTRQAGRIEEMNGRLASLLADLRALKQQTATGESRGLESVESLKQRLDRLQSQLASEQKVHKAADKEILRSVTNEVSTMIKDNGGSSNPSSNLRARGTYTVKQGDTLSAIARAFGVSIQDIKKINNLKTDLIREGQKLLIPQD